MDDLMIKTVGLMDTLPGRIEKLESYVRELENNFSRHEGQQEQGIKRISDRISTIETQMNDLHQESLRQIQELKKDIESLESIEGLTDEQKELIGNIKETVDLLLKDYESRQHVKKTLWYYIVSVIDYFIRYTMLPITIAVLLFIGFAPEMIPGYKPENAFINSEDDSYFNEASVELMMLSQQGKINESDVRSWMKKYPSKLVIVSKSPNLNSAVQTNYRVTQKHFFVWLPDNVKDGYIQIYGMKGRKIGSPISIVRGK
jgi:hypothetical protein